MGLEAGVAARPVTRKFFENDSWALTLAPGGNRRIRSSGFRTLPPTTGARPRRGLSLHFAPKHPAVANPPAIPPTLIPPTGLAPLRGPIPLPGAPGPPPPGRPSAGHTAIPRLRMLRLEPLPASLQQATPTPRTTPPLNTRTSPAMLGRAQGRCQLPKGQVAEQKTRSAPRRLLPDATAPCTCTPTGSHSNRHQPIAPWLPWLRENGSLLGRHRHSTRPAAAGLRSTYRHTLRKCPSR